MEWRDEGVILSVRKHGESSAIVEILTAEHGRSLGLVRGGRSRANRPILQPGNLVQVAWRARLDEHLGNFTIEPISLKAGAIMEDRLRLAGLSTLAALSQLLPEREPHRRIYDATVIVLDAIEHDGPWQALLVRWEMGLLDELGFGLDLSKCAATGSRENLIYVSPRTGRAVCADAGAEYHERLLVLPSFLLSSSSSASVDDIAEGFRLTGFFLDRHIFGPRGIKFPEQREWIVRELAAGVPKKSV